MMITDDQFQKIANQFNSFVPDGIKCPICGKNDWIIGDSIAEIPLGHDENGLIVAPAVLLSCKNCGNIQLFNAFKLGIAKPDDNTQVDEQNNNSKHESKESNNG